MCNLTENRRLWLSTIEASSDWIRDNGRSFNFRTDRRMPEPVYLWLIENKLIDCDCGNLSATTKGRELLKEQSKHV